MPNAHLIRHGLVIDTDPAVTVLGHHDVLVEDGRISAVGPGLAAPEGAAEIDATGLLVLPGFVDAHRHTWQAALRGLLPDSTLPAYLERVLGELAPRYRPEDVHTGTLAGALECLDSGITTLLDWAHNQPTPEHTDACVAALRAAGIRAVFGYCYGGGDGLAAMTAEARRVRAEHFASAGRVAMAMAAFGPEFGDLDRALHEWRLARDLDLPVTVHMGGHSAEGAAPGLAWLEDNGLAGHPLNIAHGNHYGPEQLKRIAGHGGTLSVTPALEATMGFGRPISGPARAAGVPTGLGADSVIAGPGDMFSLMRAAHQLERGRPDGSGMAFTAADALRMATIEGAEAVGLGGVTGSLRPGKHADLVLLGTRSLAMAPAADPVAAAVLAAGVGDVDTVLVGGEVVKRAGRLLHHDVPALLDGLAATAARVLG
ncbi:amidohydrolase family protein [Actinomadura macrotermitis]|uniref:Atrazine chlorohydrolase n=1 Tax=Actinomadura macrotermitis TaxID=2585200 RepID=A0A7K0BSM1_9ACTN|nr:amidohydrolase family protein [Actinomadura macrotermitis]MQY03882.1 Atrazine chlorohydrolase [Actinomadura macrotermitis]